MSYRNINTCNICTMAALCQDNHSFDTYTKNASCDRARSLVYLYVFAANLKTYFEYDWPQVPNKVIAKKLFQTSQAN